MFNIPYRVENNLQTTNKKITLKRWLTAKTADGTWERERDYRNTTDGEAFKNDWVLEHQSYANIYETPAYFTNSNASKRVQATLFATDWLWADIDGVEGATTGDEAAQVVEAICEKNDFPQPNRILCTSEGPDRLPRVSLWWKIERVYLKREKGRALWRDVAHRLCSALKGAGLDNLDVGPSCNLRGVMRLEGSKHSKTGTVAHYVGVKHDDVLNVIAIKAALPKPPTTDAPQQRCGGWSNNAHTSSPIDVSIIENQQLQILAGAVFDGERNHALYALVKGKQAAGFTLGETRDWAAAWNAECDPPEDPKKVDDVVKRAWSDGLGISAAMVAETATSIAGHTFKPDPRLIVVGTRLGSRRKHPRTQPARPARTPPRRQPGPLATKRAQLCHDLPPRVGNFVNHHLTTGKPITLGMIANAAGETRDALKRTGTRSTLFALIERMYSVQLLRIGYGWVIKRAEPKGEGQGYKAPPPIELIGSPSDLSDGAAGSGEGGIDPPGRGGGGATAGLAGSRGRKAGGWSERASESWLKGTFGTSDLQRIRDEKDGVGRRRAKLGKRVYRSVEN